MKKLSDITGLSSPEPNTAYQELILDHVFQAIILATRDEATGQAVLRNEDIVTALIDIQAMMASSSNNLSSPTKIREWATEVSKQLRSRTTAFQKEAKNGNSIFDQVIDVSNKN